MFNHDEGTTTSTRAREADVGNGVGLPFKQNERPEPEVLPELVPPSEDVESFDRMEQRLRSLLSSNLSFDEQVLNEVGGKPPRILDGTARVRIKRGVIRAGLTLSHLEYLFPWYALKNSTSPIGLLIRYAEDFENRSQGVEWPSCLVCADSGLVVFEGSKRPCTCPTGKELLETARIRCEAYRKEEEQCRLDRQKEMERSESRRRAEEEKQKEIFHLQRRNVCPICKGRSGSTGNWCDTCKATGEYRSDEGWATMGKCFICKGTGKTHPEVKCSRCAGTGGHIRRAEDFRRRTGSSGFARTVLANL